MVNPQSFECVHSQRILDGSGVEHLFEICVGDVTESSGTNPIDILAISAGLGSYHPAKGSVIHRLLERGISTETAARNKSDDWRHRWQCWLSNPLPLSESAPIRRILCFEHGAANAHPAAVVGNVFRALREWMLSVPLTEGIASPPDHNIRLFRLPLLCSGIQGYPDNDMLPAIIEQALLQLESGLSIAKIQLVLRQDEHLSRRLILCGKVFEQIKQRMLNDATPDRLIKYDFFLSYRRAEHIRIRQIQDEITRLRPAIRWFVDEEVLRPGAFWKSELLQAIKGSQRILCMVTDSYSDSDECLDEFHAGLCMQLSNKNFVVPVNCLQSRTVAELPLSLRRVQLLNGQIPPQSPEDVARKVLSHLVAGSA